MSGVQSSGEVELSDEETKNDDSDAEEDKVGEPNTTNMLVFKVYVWEAIRINITRRHWRGRVISWLRG